MGRKSYLHDPEYGLAFAIVHSAGEEGATTDWIRKRYAREKPAEKTISYRIQKLCKAGFMKTLARKGLGRGKGREAARHVINYEGIIRHMICPPAKAGTERNLSQAQEQYLRRQGIKKILAPQFSQDVLCGMQGIDPSWFADHSIHDLKLDQAEEIQGLLHTYLDRVCERALSQKGADVTLYSLTQQFLFGVGFGILPGKDRLRINNPIAGSRSEFPLAIFEAIAYSRLLDTITDSHGGEAYDILLEATGKR